MKLGLFLVALVAVATAVEARATAVQAKATAGEANAAEKRTELRELLARMLKGRSQGSDKAANQKSRQYNYGGSYYTTYPPMGPYDSGNGYYDSGSGYYDSGSGYYDSGSGYYDSGSGYYPPMGPYDSGSGYYYIPPEWSSAWTDYNYMKDTCMQCMGYIPDDSNWNIACEHVENLYWKFDAHMYEQKEFDRMAEMFHDFGELIQCAANNLTPLGCYHGHGPMSTGDYYNNPMCDEYLDEHEKTMSKALAMFDVLGDLIQLDGIRAIIYGYGQPYMPYMYKKELHKKN